MTTSAQTGRLRNWALAACLALNVGLFVAEAQMQTHDPTEVLVSRRADSDFELSADPRVPAWRNIPHVLINHTYEGGARAESPTEVRSRWTDNHLYLLYVCPYDVLTLKANPDLSAETPQLWNWDVAEAFIGSDFARIGAYKEFQVSPQGEWVDLAIDRDHPDTQEGMRWNSGLVVKARIDDEARIWYGEMRIPFAAIDTRAPQPGHELRLGLFRLTGTTPRGLHLWRPTGQPNFHVPKAFGTLRLTS